MTTTLGLSFSARSVAKKLILFALNITILILGLACSILCLYQIKLMPTNYNATLAKLANSNVTFVPSSALPLPRNRFQSSPDFTREEFLTTNSSTRAPTTSKYQETTPKPGRKTTTSKLTIRHTSTPAQTTKRSKQKHQTTAAQSATIPSTESAPKSTTTSSSIMWDDDSTARALAVMLKYLQRKAGADDIVAPYLQYSNHSPASASHSTTVATTTDVTKELPTKTTISFTNQTILESPRTSRRDQEEISRISSTSNAPSTTSNSQTTPSSLAPPSKPKSTTSFSTVNSRAQTTLTTTATANETKSTTPAYSANTTRTAHPDVNQSFARPNVSFVGPGAGESRINSSAVVDLSSPFEAWASVLQQGSAFNLSSKSKRDVNHSAQSNTPASRAKRNSIPNYFQEIFELVQTSLYTGTAAGVLVFFSSLIGICGGAFRVNGCLKCSIGALVLVIIGEMATIGFIFFAHDKATNRNKYPHFDEQFKFLCDHAAFCVSEMLLVIVGAFLCVSIVLQIGSITLSCHLMNSAYENDTDFAGNGWRKGAINRADLQLTNGMMMPFTNPMAMQPPYFAGQNTMMMPFSYPSAPMYGTGCFHQPMGGGQRPVFNFFS